MNYIIDYFKFVIKKDDVSENGQAPTFSMLLEFLGMSEYADDFYAIPGKYHYSACYVYDDVRIYESADVRADDMGYMVELSGQGCRLIEALWKQKHNSDFSWRLFFKKFVDLTSKGYSLNVPRIDFAFDDFDGLLDLDMIAECARNREYVSLFRDYDINSGGELLPWRERISCRKSKSLNLIGKTVYFGKRKSNSFFRFYDKKVEQLVKFKDDKEKVEELNKINHWVRFETEFKNKTANSIVMSIACFNNDNMFSKYLSEVINGYLRFIDIDDSNATRCTVKEWWAMFIGTAEVSSITCPGIVKDPVDRAVVWLNHSLAPTLAALIQRFGSEEFFDMIFKDNPEQRFKFKHRQIAGTACIDEEVIKYAQNSASVWYSYLPNVVCERITAAYDTDVDKAGEQLEI